MQETSVHTGVELLVVLLAALVFIAFAVRRVRLPLSVALVAFGLAVAILAPGSVSISPDLVLFALLPGLVFEAAFRIDLDDLRRVAGRVLLLAIPGVVAMALLVALLLNVVTGMPLQLGFLLGAILAATDPVAVVSSMREAGAPRQLATLVEAESLFNDGTGVLLFGLAVTGLTGASDLPAAILGFAFVIVASVAIGVATGWFATRFMALVQDPPLELTITVLVAYGTYLLADSFGQSGIIATVTAAIVLGSYGRRVAMDKRTRDRVDVVWEFISFVLTALVFLLIGLATSFHNLLGALGPIAVAVIALLLGRALVIYGWIGGLRLLARRRATLPRALRFAAPEWRHLAAMPVGWLHVASWAGLRGAVAFALALAIPIQVAERGLLQEITFGVVLFTVIVQGAATQIVMRWAVTGRQAPAGGAS
jgi:CPA1 family monovalent cation:H+ antiporter